MLPPRRRSQGLAVAGILLLFATGSSPRESGAGFKRLNKNESSNPAPTNFRIPSWQDPALLGVTRGKSFGTPFATAKANPPLCEAAAISGIPSPSGTTLGGNKNNQQGSAQQTPPPGNSGSTTPQNAHVGPPLKVPRFAQAQGYKATQNTDGSLTVTTPSGKTLRLYRDATGTLQTESATGAVANANQQAAPDSTPPNKNSQEPDISLSDMQRAAGASGLGASSSTGTTPLGGTMSGAYDGRYSIKAIEYQNQDGSSTMVLLYFPTRPYDSATYTVRRRSPNSDKPVFESSGSFAPKDPPFSAASFGDNLAQQAANAGPSTTLASGSPGAPANQAQTTKQGDSGKPAEPPVKNPSLDTSSFNDEKALEDSIIQQVEKSLAQPNTGTPPQVKLAPQSNSNTNTQSSNLAPSGTNTATAPFATQTNTPPTVVDQPAPGIAPANGGAQGGQKGGAGNNNPAPGGQTQTTGGGNTTGGAAANTTGTIGANFGTRVQGGPYSVPLYVSNDSTSTQTVQVSVQNAPWLTIAGPATIQVPPGGQPQAVEAQINTSNLPPGDYTGTVVYTYTNSADANSPQNTQTAQVTVHVVPATVSFDGPANPNDSQFRGLVNGQPADVCTVLQGAINDVANSSFGQTAAGQAIVGKLREQYLSNNCAHLKPVVTVSNPDKNGKLTPQTQAVDGESPKPGDAVYVLNKGSGLLANLFASENIYVGIDLTQEGIERARQNPGDYYIFTYQGKIGVVPRSDLVSTLIHEGLHAVQGGQYNVPRPDGTGKASSTQEEQDGFNAGSLAAQALGYPGENVTVGPGYGRGSNPNYKPLVSSAAPKQSSATTTPNNPKSNASSAGETKTETLSLNYSKINVEYGKDSKTTIQPQNSSQQPAGNSSSSNAPSAAETAAGNAANKANETKISTPPMETGAAAGPPKPAGQGALPGDGTSNGQSGNNDNGNNGSDNGANNGNAGDNPPPPPPPAANPKPVAEKRPPNFRHAQPSADSTGITIPNQYSVTVCEGTNDYVFRASGEEVDARNVKSTSFSPNQTPDATGVGFGSGIRISGNHVGASTIEGDFVRFDGTLAAHVKIIVTVIDCSHHTAVVASDNGPGAKSNPPVVTGGGGNQKPPDGGDDNPSPPGGENPNPPAGGNTGDFGVLNDLNSSFFGNAPGEPTVQNIVITININTGSAAPDVTGVTSLQASPQRIPTAHNHPTATHSRARFKFVAYHSGSPSRAPSLERLSSDRSSSKFSSALPSAEGLAFSIVASGNLGTKAIEFRVHDPSGRLKGNIALPEGMVLEPLKVGTRNPVSAANGKNILSQQLTAYCLDMAKLPPEPGQLYRLAPRTVQQKYMPIKAILEVGRKLAAQGRFHPDSEANAYADFVRQHALWAELEHWTEQKFTEVFLERTKKNAEHLNVKWTNEMTEALRAAAPGRWRDIAMVLDEAHKLSGVAGMP